MDRTMRHIPQGKKILFLRQDVHVVVRAAASIPDGEKGRKDLPSLHEDLNIMKTG